MIKLRMEIVGMTKRGQLWRVVDIDSGETIVAAARSPNGAAARALMAAGRTGIAETYTGSREFACMRFDVERTSKLTVMETDAAGPRLSKWAPPPTEWRLPVTGSDEILAIEG